MSFPNLYYKRTATAAKACYVCNKPTVTVLATIDTADFFYTCPIHLTDRGFATRAPEPEPEPEPKKASVTPEEIDKAKQEWEEKERQKTSKDGEKDGDGKNDTDKVEGKDADAATKGRKPASAVTPNPSTPPSESKPMHERYVLHRNIFALRTADHRRRRQVAQAKNLAPRLPSIPR